MPAFDGNSTIFGFAVSIVTSANPKAEQMNAYFGTNGVQSIFGGTRGRYSMVQGLLIGNSPAALSAAELLIDSYNDGIAYTFVDNFGNIWPNVILDTFAPQGRVMQSKDGFYIRPYKAGFR